MYIRQCTLYIVNTLEMQWTVQPMNNRTLTYNVLHTQSDQSDYVCVSDRWKSILYRDTVMHKQKKINQI